MVPRNDLSVYALDSQVFTSFGNGTDISPGPFVDEPLPLEDPAGLSKAAPTWAPAQPGSPVIVLGFPLVSRLEPPFLHTSVGHVLTDDEARTVIAALRTAGDEEGYIQYDAEAEFLFEGEAANGMGGSGVFDQHWRQIGVLVRASRADIGVRYLRAVRMTHVVARLRAMLGSIPREEAMAIRAYLEPL
jgi:hypothetical protein